MSAIDRRVREIMERTGCAPAFARVAAEREAEIAATIEADRLARQPAGECMGCGNEAVELATWVEDGGAAMGHTMKFCRPCMGDEADDPSLEWITGEAI
jgi:hypothetical protein